METQKVGTKEVTEVLEGLKVVATFGKKVTADGKVDIKDLPHLYELAHNAKVLSDAIEGLGQIPAELKNLDAEEAKAFVAKFYEVLATIKAA